MLVVSVFTSLLLAAHSAHALKEHDFKKCDHPLSVVAARALADRAVNASSTWQSPYSIDPNSIKISQASVSALVKTSLHPGVTFSFEAIIHEDGVARVRMDEHNGLRKRYDETAGWVLIKDPVVSTTVEWVKGKKDLHASYGDNQLRLEFQPLRVVLLRGGKEQMVINGQGLFHMEHFRNKPEVKAEETPAAQEGDADQTVLEVKTPQPNAWFEGDEEDTYWEESFSSWTDSKPKGPESFYLDINFPTSSHLYGIPQHATRLALPPTTGTDPTFTEPYRLYNLDVFEYLASSSFGIYGAIPLLHAHSAAGTVAVLNLVASETWIDIHYPTPKSANSFWMSESGILDLLILPGPTPERIFEQYAGLTGSTPLPAAWSLGYHQCRWNYVSSDDVRSVQKRMDEEHFPLDVLWLDIEYSPDHKYMIWDEKGFPDPLEMIADVEKNERHMVVIVDPHLKRVSDYPVYKDASDLGILVKPASGEGEYEGWCWPGNSAWIDFFNPAAWDFWNRVFKVDAKDVPKGKWHWEKSTAKLGIWNDMNEPSVFNGPEITMQKDLKHYGGWEHRDIHNLNGVLYHNATATAMRHRTSTEARPFVLSRAFFAGSQRFGAIWTGDNMGTWEHMAVGIPMVLSDNIAGMTFSGSDVGGFFGNPPPEMLVRWYQVGVFMPFFRAHAHIDTKRREPYLLDEPYKSIVRDILRLRYTLLPVWYTEFHTASTRGLPVLRPQYVVFPKDEQGFSIDEQFWLGDSGLLVRPVTTEGATEAQVYLSGDQPYYDYFTHAIHRGSNKHITVPAALHQVPLFLHGGSILPTRERPRRASPLMKRDPFTLTVALNRDGAAKGALYLDDGESYAFEKGALVWRTFNFAKGTLTNADAAGKNLDKAVDSVALTTYDAQTNAYAQTIADVRVEKIVILGVANKPKAVKLGSTKLEFEWTDGTPAKGKKEGVASTLVIKDPKARIVQDWSIVLE